MTIPRTWPIRMFEKAKCRGNGETVRKILDRHIVETICKLAKQQDVYSLETIRKTFLKDVIPEGITLIIALERNISGEYYTALSIERAKDAYHTTLNNAVRDIERLAVDNDPDSIVSYLLNDIEKSRMINYTWSNQHHGVNIARLISRLWALIQYLSACAGDDYTYFGAGDGDIPFVKPKPRETPKPKYKVKMPMTKAERKVDKAIRREKYLREQDKKTKNAWDKYLV